MYLPTSGKEVEFVSALSSMDACLEMIKEDYDCPIYLRGDANVNPNNSTRMSKNTLFPTLISTTTPIITSLEMACLTLSLIYYCSVALANAPSIFQL